MGDSLQDTGGDMSVTFGNWFTENTLVKIWDRKKMLKSVNHILRKGVVRTDSPKSPLVKQFPTWLPTLKGKPKQILTGPMMSKNGKYLLCQLMPDYSNTKEQDHVMLWDYKQRHLIYSLDAHHGLIRAMAISPTARWIATGGEKSLNVYHGKTGKLKISILLQKGPIKNLFFLPNEDHLCVYTVTPDEMEIIDVSTRKLVRYIPDKIVGKADQLDLSANGKLLAVLQENTEKRANDSSVGL